MPAHIQPIEKRLAAKISVRADTGCHEWKDAKDRKGYGRIFSNGRPVSAHRTVWEIENGAIPQGLVIDHLCRNRSCVNPHHMEVVTNRENVLRGEGHTAVNARKTHCNAGHELAPDNINTVTFERRGERHCKQCAARWARAYRERRKAAQAVGAAA